MKSHTVCMLAVFLFVLMANIVTAQDATAPDATACGAGRCKCCYLHAYAHAKIDELYINEQKYPVNFYQNTNGVISIRVCCKVKLLLIAIKASCPSGSDCRCPLAGLKVSAKHQGIFTNQCYWKCTRQLCPNCDKYWMAYKYNDAKWPMAVINNNFPAGPPPISPNAKWIWTRGSGWFNVDSPVYCRARYSTSIAVPCYPNRG